MAGMALSVEISATLKPPLDVPAQRLLVTLAVQCSSQQKHPYLLVFFLRLCNLENTPSSSTLRNLTVEIFPFPSQLEINVVKIKENLIKSYGGQLNGWVRLVVASGDICGSHRLKRRLFPRGSASSPAHWTISAMRPILAD